VWPSRSVAIFGIVYARAFYLLWVVLIVFAIAAVPQAIFARRLSDKKKARR
jgi:hypothetical protein